MKLQKEDNNIQELSGILRFLNGKRERRFNWATGNEFGRDMIWHWTAAKDVLGLAMVIFSIGLL
ncbi:hypothetical protein [Pedobacter sp. V48]|uniref:hypothetical protein n=1 Tax=Pedobacter sp. V48 TaxID=509635 RepID=UPI0003E5C09D|nr:hypothetical protein [Pedobacter sp. V48]ETZ22794.1 hypothetical protein N824_21115 [Pedobacter sp. V48]